jgi:hypothetical protein
MFPELVNEHGSRTPDCQTIQTGSVTILEDLRNLPSPGIGSIQFRDTI